MQFAVELFLFFPGKHFYFPVVSYFRAMQQASFSFFFFFLLLPFTAPFLFPPPEICAAHAPRLFPDARKKTYFFFVVKSMNNDLVQPGREGREKLCGTYWGGGLRIWV